MYRSPLQFGIVKAIPMAERGTREHWEENVEAGRKGLWVHSDHRDYSAYALGQSQRAPGLGSRSTSSFSNPPSTPTSNFSISSFSSPSISSSSFGGSSSSYSSGTSSASGVIGGLVVLGFILVGLGAILKDSPNSQTSSSDFRVGQSVTVGTINLNLRSGPGTNFGVVAIMPEGTRARVVGQTNDGWIELNVPAQDGEIFHGFANSSYMTSGGDDAVSDKSGQTSSSDFVWIGRRIWRWAICRGRHDQLELKVRPWDEFRRRCCNATRCSGKGDRYGGKWLA